MKTIKNKILTKLLRLLILCLLVYLLYHQFFVNHNFRELFLEFKLNYQFGSWWYLVLVIFLMGLNWLLETFRWRFLVNIHYKIPYKKAFEAILVGVTFGIISPQRIGEHMGRLLTLPARQNWLSVRASFYTSVSLNLVIIIGGVIALLITGREYGFLFQSKKSIYILIVFSSLLFVILYFSFEKIGKNIWVVEKLGKLNTWGNFSDYPFKKKDLILLFIPTFLRYMVFGLQYFLVLRFYGVDLSFGTTFMGIAIIFLIQSLIPLPGLIALLARGEIAILVLGIHQINEIPIFMATFTVWIINLLIPALIGLVLLWRIKISESLGIE